MTPLECCREADVIDAIASGRWPERASEELRAHVASCEICTDVADVASALGQDHHTAWAEAASLPTANIVWLRAQARARQEATRQAARPIAVMQALGFACAAGVVSSLIGAIAYWVWGRADWLQTLPAVALVGMDAMGFAIRGTLLAIGLWLVLAPVAVYLVAADD